MPYSSTLYRNAQGMAKAVVSTSETSVIVLTGLSGQAMVRQSRQQFPSKQAANEYISSEAALLTESGFNPLPGQFLVGEGVVPSPNNSGLLADPDAGFGIGTSVDVDKHWLSKAYVLLAGSQLLQSCSVDANSLRLVDGEEVVVLLHGLDGHVSGRLSDCPSPRLALALLKLAHEASLIIVDLKPERQMESTDISLSNSLLARVQDWLEIEDLAASVGLIPKPVHYSTAFGGDDAFF